VAFLSNRRPSAASIVAQLGDQLMLKPNCSGSSVGLHVISNATQLGAVLPRLDAGEWLVERRIVGRELTVGLLRGRAMGVVEIVPRSGVFDYSSKYTKGLTEYFAPAALSDDVAAEVRRSAETAFAAAGCRDYARIDYMLSAEGELSLLEINTLPGMKETSLLPMSARCVGLDFNALCRELVAPAIERFTSAQVVPA
jgi:D-alanine-D-alanine ligase